MLMLFLQLLLLLLLLQLLRLSLLLVISVSVLSPGRPWADSATGMRRWPLRDPAASPKFRPTGAPNALEALAVLMLQGWFDLRGCRNICGCRGVGVHSVVSALGRQLSLCLQSRSLFGTQTLGVLNFLPATLCVLRRVELSLLVPTGRNGGTSSTDNMHAQL